MCERKVTCVSGAQPWSVYIIFSVFSEGRASIHTGPRAKGEPGINSRCGKVRAETLSVSCNSGPETPSAVHEQAAVGNFEQRLVFFSFYLPSPSPVEKLRRPSCRRTQKGCIQTETVLPNWKKYIYKVKPSPGCL